MPKICIIGAGPSGITAAKNFLQQGLTDFVVFEKNHRLGGNWFFDEDNNHSSVYETTHLISSKRLSAYEDFPMPEDYPDYPSHAQMLRYFEEYAKYYNLQPFIRFNTTVLKSNFKDNKWHITYQDPSGCHDGLFDYLIVANGHHWDPFLPDYKGHFDGEVLHSHAYKKAECFRNQRVLVVGGGNSACDLAVEISRVSAKTCISMRHGHHIFPKFIFGKPTDVLFSKIHRLPLKLKQLFAGWIIRIIQGRYAKYNLQTPHDKPLQAHPTINSELLYFIRHGKIFPRVSISSIEGNTVSFFDGKSDEFDTIIFATGYNIHFPFFDKTFIHFDGSTGVPLYRKMMHPKWDSLYFIGLFQPQGCIWPLADYQAKIAARIIQGSLRRPADLEKRIAKEIKENHARFKQSPRHMIEVDYHLFRQQLLAELGQ